MNRSTKEQVLLFIFSFPAPTPLATISLLSVSTGLFPFGLFIDLVSSVILLFSPRLHNYVFLFQETLLRCIHSFKADAFKANSTVTPEESSSNTRNFPLRHVRAFFVLRN